MTTPALEDPTAPFDEPYPDAELAIREHLSQVAPAVSVLVTFEWPKIRVSRIGGGEEDDATDGARILIRCYARPSEQNPRASQNLARRVRLCMKELADGGYSAGTVIDKVTKTSGPVTTPFEGDPEVRVTELIYRVAVRD